MEWVPPNRAAARWQAAAGERRRLTVMFCDLANSTSLAGRVDPEDYRDIVQEFQAIAEESVTRYGGRVAQFLGDGVLASFGFPAAHDDDPRRAVMAGLAIVRRIVAARNPDLAARIAVHTGAARRRWHR